MPLVLVLWGSVGLDLFETELGLGSCGLGYLTVGLLVLVPGDQLCSGWVAWSWVSFLDPVAQVVSLARVFHCWLFWFGCSDLIFLARVL